MNMTWTCNEVTYYGASYGNGDRVLVLLHGFTGTHRTWLSFVEHVSNDFRILCIDLLGHGQTESPLDAQRYDITRVAADLIAILDQQNIAQAHFIGYSMGGRVALTTAVLYPERVASLILESSTPGLKTEQERFERCQNDQKLAQQLLRDGLEAFIDMWEQLPLFQGIRSLPIEVQRSLRKERLSHNPLGLANSLIGMGTGAMPSLWEHLPHLTMPVQLITGEQDEKFVQIAKSMTTYNTTFKHISIPMAGHTVHLEQPKAFLEVVRNFYFSQNQKI